MGRWTDEDEAERVAALAGLAEPAVVEVVDVPAINKDSCARIVIGLVTGGKIPIIADCRVAGLEVKWTVECDAALLLLETAVESLRRRRGKTVDGGQCVGEPVDPRGKPQARLMRLLFGPEYRNDTLETLRLLAAAEFDGDGDWLKAPSEFTLEESENIIRRYQESSVLSAPPREPQPSTLNP